MAPSLLLNMWSVDQQHQHHWGIIQQAHSNPAEIECDFNRTPRDLYAH